MPTQQPDLLELAARRATGDLSTQEFADLLPYVKGGTVEHAAKARGPAAPATSGFGPNPALGMAPRFAPARNDLRPLERPNIDKDLRDLYEIEKQRVGKDLTLSQRQIDEQATAAVYGDAPKPIDRSNIGLVEAADRAFSLKGTRGAAGAIARDAFWRAVMGPFQVFKKTPELPGAQKSDEGRFMAALRVAGTTASALPQEAIAEAVVDPLSGTTPEDRGLTQGSEGGVSGFLKRALQRIERGQGFWEDFYAAGGKAGLSETNRERLGYAGLALDILVPWEAAFKAPALAGKAAKGAKALGEVVPDAAKAAPLVSRLVKTLRGSAVDFGTVTERVLAKKMAEGTFKADDIPETLLERMSSIMQGRGGKVEGAAAGSAGDMAKALQSGFKDADEEKALMGQLAQAFKLPDAPPAKDLAEDLVAMTAFGERVGDVGDLTPVQQAFAKLAGEAVRQTARESMGDYRLVHLADNVLVTPLEAKRIKGALKRAESDIGKLTWAKEGEEVAAKLSAKQRDAIGELDVLGRGVGDTITPEAFTKIRTDWINHQAGVSADLLHTLKGTRQFHEVVLSAAKRAAHGAALDGLPGAGIIDDVMEKLVDFKKLELPRATRIILDQETSRLASNTAEATREIRELMAEGATKEEAVLKLAGDEYKLVPVSDIEHMDAIKKIGKTGKKLRKKKVKAAVDAVLASAGRIPDEARALLKSKDPVEQFAGLRKWRRLRVSEITTSVNDMLKLAFEDAIRATRNEGKIKTGMGGRVSDELRSVVTGIEQRIGDVKLADRMAVYKEVVETGRFDGPVFTAVKDSIAPRAKQANTDTVSLGWMLKMRANRLWTEASRRIVRRGLGIKGKNNPVATAAMHLLTGKGAIPNEASYQKAKSLLYRTGLLDLAPDEAADFIVHRGGQVETILPPALSAALVQARNLGLMGAVDLGKAAGFAEPGSVGKAVRKLNSLQKALVTYPHPAFHLSNFAGIPFMIAVTQGPAKAATTIGTMFRHPDMVAGMVRRLTRFDTVVPEALGRSKPWRIFEPQRVSGQVFETPTGIYTLEELVDTARIHGLERTFANTEFATTLDRELARLDPGIYNTLRRSLSGWNGILREFTSATEQFWRSGVFLDALKKGSTPDEASRLAREAAYDYGALTQFEQEHLKNVFLFYSFARKNADAFLKALFNHPERVGQQLRFFRDQAHWWSLTEQEQAGMRERQLHRLILGVDRDTQYNPDGTLSSTDNMRLSNTAVMPLPEAMFLTYNLLNTMSAGLLGGDFKGSVSELGGQMSFPIQMATELATGKDAGGWASSGMYRREVPQWMMETPGVSELMNYMGAEFVPLSREKDYPRAVVQNGILGRWLIPNPKQGKTQAAQAAAWSVLSRMGGRIFRTLDQVDKARRFYDFNSDRALDAVEREGQQGVFQVVPPEVAPALGMGVSPVVTEQEMQRRKDVSKSRDIQARQRATRERL